MLCLQLDEVSITWGIRITYFQLAVIKFHWKRFSSTIFIPRKKCLEIVQHVARGRDSGLKHNPEKAVRRAVILRYCSLAVRIHSYTKCIPASVASEIQFFVPAQISC